MGKCICEGNWRRIVEKSEPNIDRRYKHDRMGVKRFAGIVHASDDYYYLMVGDGTYELLSCVGYIENYGYELVDD